MTLPLLQFWLSGLWPNSSSPLQAGLNTRLPGYNTPFGNKNALVVERTGPVSYSQMPTGDTLQASLLGWGGLDYVCTAYYTDSSTYYVEPVYAGTGARAAVAQVALKWVVTSSGAEVPQGTNLSAELIRIFILGV